MSLFEFYKRNICFHWGNHENHLVCPASETIRLKTRARLGQRTQSKGGAKVFAAECPQEYGLCDTVANKIVKYERASEKELAHDEVEVLKCVHHHHIVAYLGSYIQNEQLGIIMFPVAAWDLEEFLSSPNIQKRLDMMRQWFGCLARTLIYLHSRPDPIKHKDIKPANILIDISGAIFLTDFGTAKRYPNKSLAVTKGDNRFTVEYGAMKQILGQKQGLESDIFSLGCVFFEMAMVIFGQNLVEQMYPYITGEQEGQVVYYEVVSNPRFEQWVKAKQTEISTQISGTRSSFDDCLLQKGLPIILEMMKDPNHNQLDNICEAMDSVCGPPCRSCVELCPSCVDKVF
jgi:serine/threonine protein kinase